jgi:hypothetical protein
MTKKDVLRNQLDKYCKLKENEKILVIDEKIFRKDSIYEKSFWGAKNKDRVAKAMLMHWQREIENYRHKITREITADDVVELKQSMEKYQRILDSIIGGYCSYTAIEKTDILESLISDTKSELFEYIEFKKKGYVPEGNRDYVLHDKHVVTVIECEKYLTIKEIYIPYAGTLIQLPTNKFLINRR